MNIKMLRCPDYTVAMFDTKMKGEEPMNGKRVKHYVKEEKYGYMHVCHYLESKETPPICVPGVLYVSERVFFGKYRAVERIDGYQANTWGAIAKVVVKLEDEK